MRGIVRQVIPWEDRHNRMGLQHFESNNGDEYDMVLVTPVLSEYYRIKAEKRGILWRMARDFLPPIFKIDEELGEKISKIEDWQIVQQSFPIWVRRPCLWHEGQEVEVQVNLTPILGGKPEGS